MVPFFSPEPSARSPLQLRSASSSSQGDETIEFSSPCIIILTWGCVLMIGDEFAHRSLVENLRKQFLTSGEIDVEVIETHISSIILAGGFAYKIKKPLDLGFLDFSTRKRRNFCCHEEVRLNSRLAPEIYIDVVPITGSISAPHIHGSGEILDYAVRMNRFDQEGLLATHADRISEQIIDTIVSSVANFHLSCAIAGEDSHFGTPDVLLAPALANFTQIRALMTDEALLDRLSSIERWMRDQQNAHVEHFRKRKSNGFIRECHGDLHLGNMVFAKGQVIIFDGIEFNPELRWIDTMSELAFLMMDLDEKARPELATRALNAYMHITGDYDGIRLLPFYLVYRAMVRAKVGAVRISQLALSSPSMQKEYEEFSAYLAQAEGYIAPHNPGLVIMHGVSGSGKSTIAQALLRFIPAVWLRSDQERKRLLKADELLDRERPTEALYNAQSTKRTYEQLFNLTRQIISSGFSVIVDATFLDRSHRLLFTKWAQDRELNYTILDIQAERKILEQRIVKRMREASTISDADLAVLKTQLKNYQPLEPHERHHVIGVNQTEQNWFARLLESLLA